MSRGLFRLWITCSAVWLGIVGWMVYGAARIDPALQNACFERTKSKASGINPFECFDGVATPDLAALLATSKTYAFTAILPIAGVFLLGLVIRWVVAGFRTRAATDSNLSA